MNCPLCGYHYDEEQLICHAACPLAKGCAIICCPNCGYQMVDERKSGMAKLMRRLLNQARPATPNVETQESTHDSHA